MQTLIVSEWIEAVDAAIQDAINEVVRDYMPTLDDYLDALDKGDFECECANDIEIRFTPDHKVLAIIQVQTPNGFPWAFRRSAMEAEIDGAFEARLNS